MFFFFFFHKKESLGTKIHRNEAAADRQESITGNLVLTTELKKVN